mgnify:CR=1 FL=1
MTQNATQALATIRRNLQEATEKYGHIEPGEAGYNIAAALRTIRQALDNLHAEEEQQLAAAVALNTIDLEVFHAHILQLLGAHFATLSDNTCALITSQGGQALDLAGLRYCVAEQFLITEFATKGTE